MMSMTTVTVWAVTSRTTSVGNDGIAQVVFCCYWYGRYPQIMN